MKKTITVCDSCGVVLKCKDDIFKLKLETDYFAISGSPGPDYDKKIKDLEFCEKCASNIKQSLETICERIRL